MSSLLRRWIYIFLINPLWRYLCFFLVFVLHKHLSDRDFCTHTIQGLVYKPRHCSSCPKRLKGRQRKYLSLSDPSCCRALGFQTLSWPVSALKKIQQWVMHSFLVFEATLKYRGQLFGQLPQEVRCSSPVFTTVSILVQFMLKETP